MSFRLLLGLATLLSAANVGAEISGDAKAGEAKAAVCAACHGMDGNSPDPQYPKIAGQHERFTADQLAKFKDGRRPNPIMLGFTATLSEQDMHDLGAFFATKRNAPGLADESVVTTEGPHKGKKLYAVGEQIFRGGKREDAAVPACMACHGPTGRGNPESMFPALAGQHANYTAAVLKLFRSPPDPAMINDPNFAIMAAVSKPLSDFEIEALATYLEGLYATDSAAGGP